MYACGFTKNCLLKSSTINCLLVRSFEASSDEQLFCSLKKFRNKLISLTYSTKNSVSKSYLIGQCKAKK